MADNDSSAMTAIVAIIAIVVILGLGYYAMQMFRNNPPEGNTINVNIPVPGANNNY